MDKNVTKYVAELVKLIGWDLRQKREARGLSQAAIAEEAGIPLASYQQMESGKRRCRIDTFLRVLIVFNLDVMRALETKRPMQAEPGKRMLLDKLEELLSAPEPWPTVATYNVEAVFMKYKGDTRKAAK
jgi:transcriptional regulator with XRE-family HTH domain